MTTKFVSRLKHMMTNEETCKKEMLTTKPGVDTHNEAWWCHKKSVIMIILRKRWPEEVRHLSTMVECNLFYSSISSLPPLALCRCWRSVLFLFLGRIADPTCNTENWEQDISPTGAENFVNTIVYFVVQSLQNNLHRICDF